MARKAQSLEQPNRAVRDAEATQPQILDAAEIEFAQHGLHGTRVDPIAARAGVAPRMLYYYFQSKQGLEQAVLQRPAAFLQAALEQLNLNYATCKRSFEIVAPSDHSIRNDQPKSWHAAISKSD